MAKKNGEKKAEEKRGRKKRKFISFLNSPRLAAEKFWKVEELIYKDKKKSYSNND